jgi:hypothetical protein
MNAITQIFFTGDDEDLPLRMKSAFVDVVKSSTWYSCQQISSPFTDEELSQLAIGMSYYVTARSNVLYEHEEILSPEILKCRIGIFDLAARYSLDFLYETAQASPKERSLKEFRNLRDRMSASCLFHYKCCCIEEKLFSVSWVSKWLRISKMVDQESGRYECTVEALLSALESMEAWTDEIQAMKARQDHVGLNSDT